MWDLHLRVRPGPVLSFLFGVRWGCAQAITGQITEVTCPVICPAQPKLTSSKTYKRGPVQFWTVTRLKIWVLVSAKYQRLVTLNALVWCKNVGHISQLAYSPKAVISILNTTQIEFIMLVKFCSSFRKKTLTVPSATNPSYDGTLHWMNILF